MKDCILAIDAGGTVFKYTLVSKEGQLLTPVFKLPIHSAGTAQEVLGSYRQLITHALELSDSIIGIGVSTPGPFDYDNGTSLMKHKFQAIYGVPLREKLREYCGKDIPVWFCHDAVSFLAGEYAFGAGKDYDNVIGITIGTGLGVAVASDGQVLLGEDKGTREEIYNIPCLEGILEDYVSGRGIAAYYRRLCSKDAALSEIANATSLTAKDVGMAAPKDENARKAFDEVGCLLGQALAPMIAKYGVEAVVIGGQVANSFAWMKEGIERGIGNDACKVLRAQEIDYSAMKGVLALQALYS